MRWASNFLSTSIGRKQLMALTGLMMSGFLVGHLSGNLMLFAGDGGVKFNAYAAWLGSQVWLVPAELGLVLILLVHFGLAWRLSMQNRRARGSRYRHKDASDAGLGSRTMLLSGMLVLFFLIIHLKTFKYGDHSGPQGLYGLVVAEFRDPIYSSFYILSMIVLGFHLSHGIQSAFQTFGLHHPTHHRALKRVLVFLAIVLCIGFATMPLWFMTAGRSAG